MKTKILAGLLLMALALSPVFAQSAESYQAGAIFAKNFAYGFGNVGPIRIINGPYSTGTVTFVLDYGRTTTGDGITFYPLATNAPVLVGAGSNQETLTPTAVSCSTPSIYGSCTVTFSGVANVHGTGDMIQSSTFGLAEAVNYAMTLGGGAVIVDRTWTMLGGTTSTITGLVTANAMVPLIDYRSQPNYFWGLQPTNATAITAPTTLTASTAVFGGTGGWSTSTYYLAITYVDAMGGESAPSGSFSEAGLATSTLTITSPAAATGAVGWRAYGGVSAVSTQYELPISSSTCTLSTLTPIPACAIGSNGTFSALWVNTSRLVPNAASSPTPNLYEKTPLSHTAFAYAPSAVYPIGVQTNFTLFPQFGSTTSGQIDVLGSFDLPTGYLNYLGRTIRVSGKILGTTWNTAVVPVLTIALGWNGNTSSGAPVALCTITGPAVGATATEPMTFSCTATVTTVSATNGAAMATDGYFILGVGGAYALGSVLDGGNATPVGSLNLAKQDEVYITLTSGSATTANLQLLDAHFETLQ